jgi:glycosyltransferase involved in cell wall biosynthesis
LLALDAFAKVVAQRTQTRLVFIGDGVLRNDIQAAIIALGLEGKVFMAGLMPPAEIANVLRAADLYLMSSAYEGMPISVLEAIGTGLPVVSTNVGELPRVVVNGKNGFLVNVHTADNLSSAILNVLTGDRPSFRDHSILIASDYVPERVLEPVYKTYIGYAASVLR